MIQVAIKVVTIILCSSFALGLSIDDHAVDDQAVPSGSGVQNEQPASITPSLSSKSKNLTAFEGDTIALPCQVADMGNSGYGTLWRYNDDSLFFASTVRIVHDLRYSVKQESKGDFGLTISNVTASDAGKYSCTLSIPEGPSVVYHLMVKARPATPPPTTKDGGIFSLPSGHSAGACNNCQICSNIIILVTGYFVTRFSRT